MTMIMRLATIDLCNYSGGRLRDRCVHEQFWAHFYAQTAKTYKKVQVGVIHGGAVANSYKYPVETEVIVTVAFPDGAVWQQGTRINANKITNGKILAACIGDFARPYGDNRFSAEKRKEAKKQIIQYAEARLNAFKRA